MTSDARTHPTTEDEDLSAVDERGPGESAATAAEPADAARERRSGRTKAAARKAARTAAVAEEAPAPRRKRAAVPLVPVLAVLLVLLLGAGGFLWSTRAESSAVTTGDYVEVLQAARSDVVDFTSFDHLTLDDDIEQVRRVALGDLRDQAVEQLDSRRQEITDSEAVVSTEIVAAGVTRANADEATVLMVIQTTRETNQSEQAQVVKYRIEVELTKTDGRWLLSRITGA